jgi:hypothetical protein
VLTERTNVSRRLAFIDKLRVAVDLASSVLQLYKTPWLNEQWSDNDVYFIQRPGLPSSMVFEHPFVYRKFSPAADESSRSSQSGAHSVIRNETLFTLGILLTELLFGVSIEELQTPDDLNHQGTPGIIWCTVDRILENKLIEAEAGPRYQEAVRRCIRCDFDQTVSSLDDSNFQRAVFEGVVAPLEKTLQQFISLD